MLQDAKRDCQTFASMLPTIEVNGKETNRYEDYDINVLADRYCEALDNHDEHKINIYSSALILRFWYQIDKMYQKCKTSGIDREDLFFRLYECINVACEYRAWQDPARHTNAQACINQAIASRGAAAVMYEANLDKNKSQVLAMSLDDELDSSDPESGTWADTIASEDSYEPDSGYAEEIVQGFIDRNQLVEAIILDTIATRDVFKHEKKTVKEIGWDGKPIKHVEHTSEFWPFKLVQELNDLGDDYVDYFMEKYSASLESVQAAHDAIVKATNTKKYAFLDATLAKAKTLLLEQA